MDNGVSPLYVNKVHCMDCLKFMRKLPDASIDMILTDPPYGISFHSNLSKNHRPIKNDDFESWFRLMPAWLAEFRRILKDDGVIVLFAGGGGRTPVLAIQTQMFVDYFQLITTAVWDKKRPGLGWRYRSRYESILIGSKSKNFRFYDQTRRLTNIFTELNVIPRKGEHPTPKPLPLIERILKIHTLPGDLVLDPFLGGGTTALACALNDRKFIGIEIDREYCRLARKNLLKASIN